MGGPPAPSVARSSRRSRRAVHHRGPTSRWTTAAEAGTRSRSSNTLLATDRLQIASPSSSSPTLRRARRRERRGTPARRVARDDQATRDGRALAQRVFLRDPACRRGRLGAGRASSGDHAARRGTPRASCGARGLTTAQAEIVAAWAAGAVGFVRGVGMVAHGRGLGHLGRARRAHDPVAVDRTGRRKPADSQNTPPGPTAHERKDAQMEENMTTTTLATRSTSRACGRRRRPRRDLGAGPSSAVSSGHSRLTHFAAHRGQTMAEHRAHPRPAARSSPRMCSGPSKAVGGHDDHGGSIAGFEELPSPTLAQIKSGVQWGLFASAVMPGAEEHHWPPADILDLTIPGAFAMTEIGHGSDVASIGTTARTTRRPRSSCCTPPARREGPPATPRCRVARSCSPS